MPYKSDEKCKLRSMQKSRNSKVTTHVKNTSVKIKKNQTFIKPFKAKYIDLH